MTNFNISVGVEPLHIRISYLLKLPSETLDPERGDQSQPEK